MDLKKEFNLNQVSLLSMVPFIFLLSIGLIYGSVTLHQKVFKTFLIFIFDLGLIILFFFNSFNRKNRGPIKVKYLLFFAAYFFYILFQFLISFLSKEISYDRNYYLANYTFLIIFSLFFFLYLKNTDDIKLGLLLIQLFILIVVTWSLVQFIGMVLKQEKIENLSQITKIIMSLRPKLSFGNTNYFAGYLIGLLPLTLLTPFIFYRPKQKISLIITIVSAVIAVLGLLALFLTQTTGAYFGLYLGLVIMIPLLIMISRLSGPLKIIFLSLFLFIFIALPLILLLQPQLIEWIIPRLSYKLKFLPYVIKDRMNGWLPAWHLFTHHPLTGAGLGTVYAASFKFSSKYYYLYSSSNSFKHSHNEYMEILGEGGSLGLAFFLILTGLIIGWLIRNVINRNYKKDYRLLALGVAIGLISMLGHQFFSLTLRMSVTMSVFFSLLGMGVFLISYAPRAQLDSGSSQPDPVSSKIRLFLSHTISSKGFYTMLLILAVLIAGAFILFSPLFRSEAAIVSPNHFLKKIDQARTEEEKNELIDQYNQAKKESVNKAVKIMPDNVYAWTEKYSYDYMEFLSLLRYFNSNEVTLEKQYLDQFESAFQTALDDINQLHAIIPAYQDVWDKYAELYVHRSDYLFLFLRRFSPDKKLLADADESLDKIFYYLDKSLDYNFLNIDNHLHKLMFLANIDHQTQFNQALRDYVLARLLLEYGRQQKNIKERLHITFNSQTSGLEIRNKQYYINIHKEELNQFSRRAFVKTNFNRLKSQLDREMRQIFNQLIPTP